MTGENLVSHRRNAADALKRILPSLQRTPPITVTSVTRLLNDEVPDSQGETFGLSAALHNTRFRAAVTSGHVTAVDIHRLRQFMSRDLGFSDVTATWVAEAWRFALAVQTLETHTGNFSCPHCAQDFTAYSYWRDQKLVCPVCNSHVHFNNDLQPELKRKGWAAKRQCGGDWKLIGSSGKTRSTFLRERLQFLLTDETIDNETIAQDLGLEEIVDAIPDQVATALSRHGRFFSLSQQTAIVRSVVAAVLGNDAYDLQNILRSSNHLADRINNAEFAEIPIASYAWLRNCDTDAILTFKSDSVIYTLDDSAISVSYSSIGESQVQYGSGPTELKISEQCCIDLSGSGLSRIKLKMLLTLLGGVFRAIKQNLF